MRTEDSIAPEALRAELDRICESFAFRHSLRHQQFLRHLIACKLAGRYAELREIALGIEFFGRSPSTYDPKVDPVVRVEAGRLRQRLDRYYHAEGTAAPFEILLDKGGYLPVFRARAPAALAIGAQPSIAVLAVPVATPAPEDAALAAALTDELVRTLSRLPQVRVLGPESFAAADVGGRFAELRRRLRVEWVVRSRWRDGRRVLSIEILGAEMALLRQVDIAAVDPLALHRSLRSEILHAFVPLIGQAGTDAAAAGASSATTTRDLGAFDLYQRARYLLRQRNQSLLGRAIEHLEVAVRADPNFAAAWAELAYAYTRRRHLVFDAAARDPTPAQRAARRAIELDDGIGSAFAILGDLAYTSDFDWAEADRLFARALAASPRDVGVRSAFAAFLMYSARFEESLREYDVIQALDPLHADLRCNIGALYFYWRRYDRAETVLAQAIEMAPADVYARLLLADTYAQSGRLDESLRVSCELVAIAPDYPNSYVYRARALRMLGREEEAAATMRQARERFDAGVITEYEDAMLQVAFGEIDATFESLERYALRKANGAHCIPVDPTFATLHRDPRWASMLARVGLPDFRQ